MTQHLRRGTLAFSCATLVAMGGCFLTGPDDSIALDVSSLEIFVTESRSVVAADANVVPGSITWTSSDPRVATVDSEGLVVGVAVGTATIEARVGDIVNSVVVTVLPLMNFVYPVNGVLNRDIFHVNYVGHTDAVGRTTDYQCGYRWGRATGSNIIAPSRAYLDSNVVVVAAAAGTVTEVHDGDPDLIINDFNPARILGNFVRLAHRDGFETIYGHLKQGSVGVMVGQVVEAAAPIGALGTTGQSIYPNVQFEILRNGDIVDPFKGPCGPNFTQWASPIPYQDQTVHIASGIAKGTPSSVQLRAPIPSVDTLTTNDRVMTFWVQETNFVPGTLVNHKLIGPNGVEYNNEFVRNSNVTIGHSRATFNIPSNWPTGTGRWESYRNNVLIAQRSFEFVSVPQAGAAQVSTGDVVETGIWQWGISQR